MSTSPHAGRGWQADRPRRAAADATTFLTAYVVLLVAIPSRLVFGPLGAAGTPAQLLGIAGAGWWLVDRVASRGGREPSGPCPVRTAMFAFATCVLLSFVKATSRPIDATELNSAQMALLSVMSWLGVLLVAHDGIVDRDRLHVLVRRMVQAGGWLALFGLVQFVTGRVYTDLISVPGLTAHIPLDGVMSRDGFARPAATGLSPIEFGVFLTICLPLALHLAVLGGGGRFRRWSPVLSISVAIPLSISRSALIGTGVVLLLLLPTWPPARRRAAAAFVTVLLMSVFVLVPGLLGSIFKLFTGISNDDSALSRTGSYPLAWEFIRRDPVFGRGFLTFLPKYRILDNQYLGLLIDVGVVGLLSVLCIFLTGIVIAFRCRAAMDDPVDRDLALCAGSAVAAGASSLAFFDAFSFPLVSGMLFLSLGVLGSVDQRRRQPDPLGRLQ